MADPADRDGIYADMTISHPVGTNTCYSNWGPNGYHFACPTILHPGTFNGGESTQDVVIGFKALTTDIYHVKGGDNLAMKGKGDKEKDDNNGNHNGDNKGNHGDNNNGNHNGDNKGNHNDNGKSNDKKEHNNKGNHNDNGKSNDKKEHNNKGKNPRQPKND